MQVRGLEARCVHPDIAPARLGSAATDEAEGVAAEVTRRTPDSNASGKEQMVSDTLYCTIGTGILKKHCQPP